MESPETGNCCWRLAGVGAGNNFSNRARPLASPPKPVQTFLILSALSSHASSLNFNEILTLSQREEITVLFPRDNFDDLHPIPAERESTLSGEAMESLSSKLRLLLSSFGEARNFFSSSRDHRARTEKAEKGPIQARSSHGLDPRILQLYYEAISVLLLIFSLSSHSKKAIAKTDKLLLRNFYVGILAA